MQASLEEVTKLREVTNQDILIKKYYMNTCFMCNGWLFHLLLFMLTANGFLPGDSDTTIRHNTQ
jgi:hypothetical protein